jgi:hypothetical protein
VTRMRPTIAAMMYWRVTAQSRSDQVRLRQRPT